MLNEIANANSLPICLWKPPLGRNPMQNYKFLSISAQDLAEICYKKLQIANFSAGDVRMWWENLEVSRILFIFET